MINLNFKKWLQTLEQFSHAQSIIADAHGEPGQLVSSLQTASSFLYDCTLLVKVRTDVHSGTCMIMLFLNDIK